MQVLITEVGVPSGGEGREGTKKGRDENRAISLYPL